MGKTRDLFKKIRDIKGRFHAKIGSIKDRNESQFFSSGGQTIGASALASGLPMNIQN